MKRAIPRLMITGVSSGSGKTTVTCALLTELIRRGLKTVAFKCGPDYIDTMFHSKVIGAKSRNLDLYLSDENTVRRLIAHNAAGCDIAIIEGVMGYYDGLAGKSVQASSYHLAQATDTPAILVVDCKGMSASVAAVAKGFSSFREHGISGVLLNRAPAAMYCELKNLIENETDIKVYGYLPDRKESALKSRHLGLVTAEEVQDLKGKLNVLAEELAKTVEVDALLDLAVKAPPIEEVLPDILRLERSVRIAIAQDKAFCFYYQDSLDILAEMGIEWAPFSPLQDKVLPEDVAGLLLGGGYPELYAKQLSQNERLLADIREKLSGGMPCIAECGGFMYLHQNMEDVDGEVYPMAGLIKGDCYKTDKLTRFGYAELIAQKDGLLHKKGETTRVHEFHYWDSDDAGRGYVASKPLREESWDCVCVTDTMYAGYPHLYLAADHAAAWRFAQACATYGEGCK